MGNMPLVTSFRQVFGSRSNTRIGKVSEHTVDTGAEVDQELGDRIATKQAGLVGIAYQACRRDAVHVG